MTGGIFGGKHFWTHFSRCDFGDMFVFCFVNSSLLWLLDFPFCVGCSRDDKNGNNNNDDTNNHDHSDTNDDNDT